jgi:endogenous inhibitor of DNA gyrase (YacG/DUF329 family)
MSETPANDNGSKQKGASCPVCGRLRSDAYRPFCSRRCADVDLHRWLSGGYVIPGRGLSADDEEGDERSVFAPRPDDRGTKT